MKISIVLMLFTVMAFGVESYSQNKKFALSMEHASVHDVIHAIEAQSEFIFFYQDQNIDLNQIVSVVGDDLTVEEILDQLFAETGNNYLINDRQIIVGETVAPAEKPTSTEYDADVQTEAQQRKTISGTVRNQDGETLPNVTVIVKGTTMGVTTDIDGNFNINVPLDAQTLMFSFVGMKSQEIEIGDRTQIDIVLEEEAMGLDEVVAIGYGTVKRRDLTGAVSSVKSEEITMAPVTNVMEALQGRVAGLDITRTSGRAGSEPEVLLRGNRSLNASNSPMYVIDGIPGSIATLNPNDIESVEILKDASSTAIYGSAGANGVIIVTTKQAEKGKVQVDIDSYVGINGFALYPSALMGQEWFDYLEAGYVAAYGEESSNLSDLLTSYSMSPDQLNPYITENKWIDWVEETLETGIQQNHNISVRGGNESTRGYMSLGYNSEKGIYKYDKVDIITLRTGVTHSFSQWVEAGVQTSLSWRDRNQRNSRINKTFGTIPLGDVYDEDGNINREPIDGHSTVSLIADDVEGVYVNNSKQIRITANPYIQLTPFKGFSYKSILGTSLYTNRTGVFENEFTYMKLAGSGASIKSAQYNTSLSYSYTWDNILNYEFDINDDHDLTLTGISSWTNSQNESGSAYNEGFDYDEFIFYNMNAGNNPSVYSSYSHTKKLSFAVRANYNYKGKYLLTLSNRWDGASQLANKWDVFPAGAIAWRISDESFMEDTNGWLSNFKLRVGYGVTGNANIAPYVTSTMVTSSPYNLTLGSSQVPLYIPTQAIGNQFLNWEKSYNTNIGIDLGLYNNRVELALEFYNTDTRDVIYNRPLPSYVGAFSPKATYNVMSNIAEMNNRGVEATLITRNIDRGEFKWNSTLTFAFNKEEVRSIDLGSNIEEQDLIALNLFLGHPKNTLYGYKKLGIWQTDEAEEAALYGREPGQIKIETVEKNDEDGNSDGGVHEYSPDDRQILGSLSPDWILGFQNNFYWKNFDLNIFTTMRWGQLIDAELLGWFKYGQINMPANYDYWTPDNPTNDYPQPNILGNKNDVALSSLNIADGSFLKIKNITLGYTLPRNLGSLIGVENMRVYGTISNPFIFTNSHLLENMDPETRGSDSFPLYRQVVFGVNLSF
ncbi:MAG: TonB-dependent receptor [Prolixibacteraceae bacterium]|nr:TonB-dependent receptor [Prolixibacteraceae bacterium]